MDIVPVPVEYSSLLVNKYLNDFSAVGHLFSHNPLESDSFLDRYDIIMRDYRTDRKTLVRVLTAYNEKLHCSLETLENLKKLEEPRTTVVITGQQAGVLTGPLYTIYKTVTTIQLAREASAKTGRAVIPLFWVASEDHDYAEIDHLDFVNNQQEIVRLTLGDKPAGKYSVGQLPVTEAVYDLIEQLETHTPPSEWKTDIINKLREMAGESGNLADWFAGIMSWLFQKHGLVIVNPMDHNLRKLWSGTFAAFLRNADLVNEKLQAGMDAVRSMGMEPQVEKVDNNVHMFLYVDGARLPLEKDGNTFTVRGGQQQWSLEELTTIAQNSPELLSPNVVLRPIAQDVLLPIMAYVAGPGEISYYALYRQIYPVFDQRMPIIYPRVNITLVGRGIGKNMVRYGVSFSDGPEGLKQKLDEYLAAQDRLGIDRLFQNFSGQLRTSFADLLTEVQGIDQELTKHGNESLNKIMYQVDHLGKKAHQYHRKSCDTVVKRFRSMENQLFPKRNWQERVFNIFPYIFKYGGGLVDSLVECPLLGDCHHKLVYLGG